MVNLIYWFIKSIKNHTSMVVLKIVWMRKKNSHRIFSYFSLKFLVQNVLNFKGGGNCILLFPTSHEHFITTVCWLSILLVHYEYLLNNEHLLIIHHKSISYQYQSLIILSQPMGVSRVLLVIWLFQVPSYKPSSTEKEEKFLFLSIFLI